MTEQEWLTCTDPKPMLEFLRVRVSDRKLRLFACACCRRVRHLFEDPRSRQAIEITEDDSVSVTNRLQAAEAAIDMVAGLVVSRAKQMLDDKPTPQEAAAHAASVAAAYEQTNPFVVSSDILQASDAIDEAGFHCSLIRDIFGNLFRSATVKRTPSTVALAQAAYDHRELPSGRLEHSRLAILADALEEAETDTEVLDHLRGPGVHVRGCWVVGLILDRE